MNSTGSKQPWLKLTPKNSQQEALRPSTLTSTPLSVLKSSREIRTKALCFDLENRPLAYWYDGETTSEITAFSWKWTDEDVVYTLLLVRDGTFQFNRSDESDAVWLTEVGAYKRFVSELESADLVYGHNIRRHDLPMLNAGLLRRQLPILKPLLTSDTLKDYPRRGGMSASLENLAAYYGLEGEKLKMTQPMWEEANRLKPEGIELARERVEGDVLLQEKLRNKLLELEILKAPRMWRP